MAPPYERLSATYLVDGIYPALLVPRHVGRSIVVFVIVFIGALVYAIFNLWTKWLVIAALITAIYLTFRYYSGESLAGFIQAQLPQNRRVHSPKKLALGRNIPAAHLAPKDWICTQEEYKNLKASLRQRTGMRSVALTEALHTQVTAAVHIDGNELHLALSDGRQESIRKNKHIYLVKPRTEMRTPKSGHMVSERLRAAEYLQRIVTILANTNGHFLSMPRLESRLELTLQLDAQAANKALMAGWSWGILEVDNQRHVQLTEAGLVWHAASSETHREYVGKYRRGQRTTRERIVVNISNSGSIGNFQFAGRDIIQDGVEMNARLEVSSVEALSALKSLLELDDIPWNHPDLRSVKEQFEVAVATNDPNQSGIAKAFQIFRTVAVELALGVTGNAAYDTLVHFFNSK